MVEYPQFMSGQNYTTETETIYDLHEFSRVLYFLHFSPNVETPCS